MAFLRNRGGIWHVCWSQNGKKHGKSLRTKSKRIADEYLKEFDYRLSKKELGQATDITLDRLLEEYLDYSRATKKSSTHERHDVPRTARFVRFLKERSLARASEITQTCVEDYQKNLIAKLSPRTVRNCMYAASGLLSFAVRRGYISNNVVKNVAKVKAQKNPPRYLSWEEWEKVSEVAQRTHLWPLVATAYYTGFRNSELRFLQWEEMDFERDVITIRNKPGFTLKNRESRTVPLSQDLKGILLPLRKENGYCFADRHKKQPSAPELSADFKRPIVKPSGLPQMFNTRRRPVSIVQRFTPAGARSTFHHMNRLYAI